MVQCSNEIEKLILLINYQQELILFKQSYFRVKDLRILFKMIILLALMELEKLILNR